MVKSEIVNVVATASVEQKVNLRELGRLQGFSHNLDVYHGRVAYFKNARMQGRVSIFSSGKLISIGTKSEEKACGELKAVARLLIAQGFVKSIKICPKIQNLVIAVNLEKTLNLEKLAETPKVIYEPEQFPALILRLEKPYKASILIFGSGKIVIAGLKSSGEIEPTMQQILKFIEDI